MNNIQATTALITNLRPILHHHGKAIRQRGKRRPLYLCGRNLPAVAIGQVAGGGAVALSQGLSIATEPLSEKLAGDAAVILPGFFYTPATVPCTGAFRPPPAWHRWPICKRCG